VPIQLPNLEADPVALESYPIVGEYIQRAHDSQIDYYNPGSKSILPGEPVEVFGRLGIAKDVILPGHFGTLVFGAWVNFLLDPSLASQILQGALVYFDLDLATGLYPGYATNVQPTNGWKLGYATGRHATPTEVALSASSPIAATTSDERVMVLMNEYSGIETVTKYGTVTDFLATA
jgi:hypothetical protein